MSRWIFLIFWNKKKEDILEKKQIFRKKKQRTRGRVFCFRRPSKEQWDRSKRIVPKTHILQNIQVWFQY